MQMNRLFEMIYILMNKNTVTAKELAERFEVSQRTVYRDVDTLALAGIPVYTIKGRGGGISLVKDFVLDKSILSEQEQSEILSALQGLAAVKTEDTAEVLGKLTSFFNITTTHWIEVDFTDWSYQNGDVFAKLKTAILERRVVEYEYFNSYGEKTMRRAEPIQLWFKSKGWYLKAYCLSKNDVRIFKLTRMRGVTLTQEHFLQRNLLESIGQSEPINDKTPDITLVLKIAPQRAYRIYDDFDHGCVTPLADGSFEVRVRWPEDEWVYATILSYGEYIEVLEPMHIKRIIAEKARRITQKYL